MIDFELGGYLLSALQVGVGNGDQFRFRDQAANIHCVLLAHRANAKYTHAQLRHNRPLFASCSRFHKCFVGGHGFSRADHTCGDQGI
jgi:hypothetical protein